MKPRRRLELRMPEDVKAWLEAEAERNGSSQNSEIVRALRAAMQRADLAPVQP